MLQEQSWCLQHIASKQSQCSKKVNHRGAGAMDQQHSARTSKAIENSQVACFPILQSAVGALSLKIKQFFQNKKLNNWNNMTVIMYCMIQASV